MAAPNSRSATVNYGIALGGKLALPNQIGFAVRVDNGWRVSATSFCQLLTLEGQHPAACTASPSSSATG